MPTFSYYHIDTTYTAFTCLSLLLPDKTDQHYYLRARCHDRQLVDKHNKLFSNNFIICYKLLLICV